MPSVFILAENSGAQDAVYQYTNNGAFVSATPHSANVQSSLARIGPVLYAANASTGDLVRYDALGNYLGVVADLSGQMGNGAFDVYRLESSAMGDLYVSPAGAASRPVQSRRLDSEGASIATYSHPSLVFPAGIDSDATGAVYIVNSAAVGVGNELYRFSANGQFTSSFDLDSTIGGPSDLVIDESAGRLYLADFDSTSRPIKIYDITTATPSYVGFLSVSGFGGGATGLALDETTGTLFICSYLDHKTYEVNKNTGAVIRTFQTTGAFRPADAARVDDESAPVVSSIVRLAPVSPLTNQPTVVYRVTFSEPVLGVATGDFTLVDASAGLVEESVDSVTPVSESKYDVTVNTGSGGIGELVLSVEASTASITDLVGHALVASHTDGEPYLVDHVLPVVLDVVDVHPDPRESSVASIDLEFSELLDFDSLDYADLELVRDGQVIPLSGDVAFEHVGGWSYRVVGLADYTEADGSYEFRVNAGGLHDAAGNPLSTGAADTWVKRSSVLSVAELVPTSTGIRVVFNLPIDPSVINIFDNASAGLGPADVSLTGQFGGPVRGSVVVSPDRRALTFLQLAGRLPSDSYTLTLRSAVDGLMSEAGLLLDGDGDGVAGGDFVASFIRDEAPARNLEVADAVRGPGQLVQIPNASAGLPIIVSSGGDIVRVSFGLSFDPTLLAVDGVSLGSDVPIGWEIQYELSAPGELVVNAFGPTSLSEGEPVLLCSIHSRVPNSATYAAKHVLDLDAIELVNSVGMSHSVEDDDGIHVVAFPSDTSGNGVASSADVSLLRRYIVGLDSGFAAYQMIDPRLVGDLNQSDTVSSTDVTLLRQFVVGASPPQIPPIPTGITITPSGLDPVLWLPRSFAGEPGQTIRVPLFFEQTDVLSIEMSSFDAVISFDPAIFESRGALAGPLLPEGWELFLAPGQSGVVSIGAAGTLASEFTPGAEGILVWIELAIRTDAPSGDYAINLRADAPHPSRGQLQTFADDGRLVLIPAPTNRADDAVDGRIRVVYPLGPIARESSHCGAIPESRVKGSGYLRARQPIAIVLPEGETSAASSVDLARGWVERSSGKRPARRAANEK
jgi:hypothetical protein